MKVLGVLLAYSPGTRLTREGLGRYLAAFLKSATQTRRVVIAVPSWSRKHMRELLEGVGIDLARVEIIGPTSEPLLLRLFNTVGAVRSWLLRPRRPRTSRLRNRVRRHLRVVAGLVAATRNILLLLVLGLYLGLLGVLGGIAALPFLLITWIRPGWRRLQRGRLAPAVRRLVLRMGNGRRAVIKRMYQDMHRQEMALIVRSANAVEGVPAWYSPTAFWSTGTSLKRPRLICVPDAVLGEFPLVFSGESNAIDTMREVEKVLREGTDFVTYSERTKERVLVERYGVQPERISVVRHAPMSLLRHIDVGGYPNVVRARRERSQVLLGVALTRSVTSLPVINRDFEFIFFPTQFRPSKNVFTLLRAYEYLRSSRLIGHKLILTGDPRTYPDMMSFINDKRLELDVLFLKDLTEPELAGCYHLASLAVNTSISEGGMPFTFTEALSVGTPVIMGDIEVTREIITDSTLADATLFDAFDWRAVADKIEWGLEHRDELLKLQQGFYSDVLLKRTWDNVVDEHLDLIDAIGNRAVIGA